MRKLQKLWIILFLGILFTAPVLFLTMPRHQYSTSERRKLKTMPAITMEGILDKSCMQSIEEYLLDHFPFREQLRRMKAYYAYDILQQKENNGIYVAGGCAGKLEYPLRESEIAKAADRMLSLKQQYFPDARTYYAIVPDKNYYQASAYGYPVMDYEKLDNILQKKLTDMSQISLWDTLTIEDYYCTDTHWRQERLQPVVDRIGEQLDFSIDLSTLRKESIYPFYGVYYGQSALPLQPDTICYYTDEIIENVQVWNLEDDQIESVYRPQITEKEGQVDLYDFYLGGASPVQVLTSPQAQTDRKLIIFRDSFGSSLAPLLSEVYHEIILIDTRYISASRLGEYVDFTDADVLFLYNTLLLNHASMLKE